jgi:hypothetical protein
MVGGDQIAGQEASLYGIQHTEIWLRICSGEGHMGIVGYGIWLWTFKIWL